MQHVKPSFTLSTDSLYRFASSVARCSPADRRFGAIVWAQTGSPDLPPRRELSVHVSNLAFSWFRDGELSERGRPPLRDHRHEQERQDRGLGAADVPTRTGPGGGRTHRPLSAARRALRASRFSRPRLLRARDRRAARWQSISDLFKCLDLDGKGHISREDFRSPNPPHARWPPLAARLHA